MGRPGSDAGWVVGGAVPGAFSRGGMVCEGPTATGG